MEGVQGAVTAKQVEVQANIEKTDFQSRYAKVAPTPTPTLTPSPTLTLILTQPQGEERRGRGEGGGRGGGGRGAVDAQGRAVVREPGDLGSLEAWCRRAR